MVMMAFSVVLDGMVFAGWMEGIDSIVQNFQSVADRLKYSAVRMAHWIS